MKLISAHEYRWLRIKLKVFVDTVIDKKPTQFSIVATCMVSHSSVNVYIVKSHESNLFINLPEPSQAQVSSHLM